MTKTSTPLTEAKFLERNANGEDSRFCVILGAQRLDMISMDLLCVFFRGSPHPKKRNKTNAIFQLVSLNKKKRYFEKHGSQGIKPIWE